MLTAYTFFKHLFDIFVSLLGMVLLLPFLILIAILIIVDSKGPIFFVQDRMGRNERNFKLFKFRTMVSDATRRGPRLTQRDDPRITKVGKFLRRHKLDELPQFFNVIMGQMSLVGPRPEIPFIVDGYTDDQRKILSVKPGIFGPSQIIDRFEEKGYPENVDVEKYYIEHVLPQKLKRDLLYLKERGFIKDLGYFMRGIISIAVDVLPAGDRLRLL